MNSPELTPHLQNRLLKSMELPVLETIAFFFSFLRTKIKIKLMTIIWHPLSFSVLFGIRDRRRKIFFRALEVLKYIILLDITDTVKTGTVF